MGHYFVSGEGCPEAILLTVYYDGSNNPDPYAVECIDNNIVAYISADYKIAFVLSAMIDKFIADTKEYGIVYIPVNDFDREEFYIENTNTPDFMNCITWIDDDFLNDGKIPFDYEKFEIIDSGMIYINPKHFQ